MISTLLDSLRKWRNRCRSCDVGGIHKSFLHNFQNIGEIARYKTVLEYQCTQCGTLWLRPDHSDFLVKVFRNELYAQWKQRSWMPTDKQIDVLNLIGGVFAHDSREVFFPCEVRLPNGSRVQRAMLTATTGRCFGQYPYRKDVAILSEEYELSPSRYALPASVRAATLIAPEKRMGYAPVNVKDAKGKRYTLSGPMHFFQKNEVLGPEILLDDSPYHGKNVVHPCQVEMYLICDMFDHGTNRYAASAP